MGGRTIVVAPNEWFERVMEAASRGSDTGATLRLLGLTAAGLVACIAVFAVSAKGGAAGDGLVHTCSATDRQFLREAKLNMLAVGTSGREFMQGVGEAEDVVRDARRGEVAVGRLRPTDPALDKTRALMGAMFREYGKAIEAKAENRKAGRHILRAYGLANFARDILSQAEPELRDQGCDVSGLL